MHRISEEMLKRFERIVLIFMIIEITVAVFAYLS
jgi:hypothetical protein